MFYDYSFTLVVFFVLLVVILYLFYYVSTEDNTSVHYMQQEPAKSQPIMLLNNPFVLKYLKQKPDETIKLSANSSIPTRVYTFWGVQISHFYPYLCAPAIDFLEGLASKTTFHSASLFTQSPFQLFPSIPTTFELKAPGPLYEDNQIPRSRYAIVVVMITEQYKPSQNIIGLVTILHVKDEASSLETKIMAQMMKHSDGHVTQLQNLFVEGERQLCVVCQTRMASVAVLPCRHAYLCQSCISNLKSCPMCRTPIQSYFNIAVNV